VANVVLKKSSVFGFSESPISERERPLAEMVRRSQPLHAMLVL
jgi:hypothetical protein